MPEVPEARRQVTPQVTRAFQNHLSAWQNRRYDTTGTRPAVVEGVSRDLLPSGPAARFGPLYDKYISFPWDLVGFCKPWQGSLHRARTGLGQMPATVVFGKHSPTFKPPSNTPPVMAQAADVSYDPHDLLVSFAYGLAYARTGVAGAAAR